ncbi:ubiquitin carboxyl-terminal hydrolase 1 [Aplochiton taeniatus]
MPGLQGENVVAALGSPIKKSKLSLKFFHKKETKRALDFSEPPAEKESETEETTSCDQVVPGPSSGPISPLLHYDKKETMVPFVGLNNLGNTCYLNSILQVLYYCPGLRDGIKKLYKLSKKEVKLKEDASSSDKPTEDTEALPGHMELLGSFNSLITSAEQLQSSFLLNPNKYMDGELSTPPRKLLNTLRQLNPMYEGYLQHDAQEVLQCILGYIQDAAETIRKERRTEEDAIEVKVESSPRAGTGRTAEQAQSVPEEDGQVNGKRKSDTEAGNAKKKPKSAKSKRNAENGKPLTRSKRKPSSDITPDSGKDEIEEKEGGRTQGEEQPDGSDGEDKEEKTTKEAGGKRKKRPKLSWLRATGKQPSIFSKFCSLGKISSSTGVKADATTNPETGRKDDKVTNKNSKEPVSPGPFEETKTVQKECEGLDLMERLFQGRLVLRTRCLECECYTERREDFQDISVPVQEDEPCSPHSLSEVSPDPKPEQKTLKWAISQFASVERIVGEDKYYCETCHHYTEAERSLLFDKTPEVITIHLKCFSANSLELDPYAGLSKVNTPLQTPLELSLEEWCTRHSATGGPHYQLFAVVMHSGVTISSGHYTTYIRMADVKDTEIWLQDNDDGEEREEDEKDNGGGGGGGAQPAAKEAALLYDDGEVSFNLKGQSPGGNAGSAGSSSKMGAKKSSEGVGLLGGQRSLSSSFDLGGSSKPSNADKATSGEAEGSRRKRTSSGPGPSTEVGRQEEPAEGEDREETSVPKCRVASEQAALSALLEYEGKWMLFDDSEVRLFEEKDFLRACSPDTCSTSTPYLLFYRKTPPH